MGSFKAVLVLSLASHKEVFSSGEEVQENWPFGELRDSPKTEVQTDSRLDFSVSFFKVLSFDWLRVLRTVSREHTKRSEEFCLYEAFGGSHGGFDRRCGGGSRY